MPGGTSPTATCRASKAITSFNDEYFAKGVSEAVKHSWYDYSVGNDKSLHPFKGETTPKYTDFQDEGKVLVAEVADLLRQADAGGPAGARAVHVRRRPRADQEVCDEGAGSRFHDRQDQGRHRRPAFDDRPPRGACGAFLPC